MSLHDVSRFHAAAAAEELLIDVAQRLQLSPTKHATAVAHYEALCAHVDRPESPLAGRVVTCYPSGSFGIGAVVASRAKTNQHDLDVVLELDLPVDTPPSIVLGLLFNAIRGGPGSRYYDKTTLNSRCVTVEYEDGLTVDLMPIVRDGSIYEKRGVLFHSKAGENYRKPVNPYGFKTLYNDTVEADPVFVAKFRALDEQRTLAKADVEPMDDHVRLEEKSPRTVALQLMKRFRDLRFRPRKGRKPPSVMLAAYALEKPNPRGSLLWELMEQAEYVQRQLDHASAFGRLVDVRNPSWREDVFTDRWPHEVAAQNLYSQDLRELNEQLTLLAGVDFSPVNAKEILQKLFGETAATYALDEMMVRKASASERGRLKFGPTGALITGPAVNTSPRAAIRSSTDWGA
ncbi:hypothetical protein [Brevundimonas naejangsanensis]